MTTYKVVWSNGDELYVEADSKSAARERASERHGPTAARIIYCRPYG